MATVAFHAYTVHEVKTFFSSVTNKEEKLITIGLGIGKPEPFPRHVMEAKNVAEIKKAFADYVASAKATGLQLSLSVRHVAGRKVSGFDKAKGELSGTVNV